jgi:hypothetical protein
MRATGTFRALKPAATGRLAGEVRRAFLACGFGLTLCLVAVIVANWLQAASVGAASRSHASSEAELGAGSMLVVPPNGNLCRERIIDNRTWRIRNNGWVDCEAALAKSANSGADLRSPGSRLDLIRDGFRGRP